MKSDNIKEIGQHAFTVAGFGAAPFKFTGLEEKLHNNGDGTTKPGSSCDYCGQGIQFCYWLKSADGRRFKVGCDCINRSGDAGLIKAYKSSREFRQLQAVKRAAKAKADRETLKEIIASRAAELSALPHPMGYSNRQTGRALTLLDWAQWMLENAGATGKADARKRLQKVLS